MIYLELFWCFFQIGLFSIGGGYAAMPLIRHQVVEVHDWLTMAEFADIITISQMTPGPISINSATFVGINIAGIPGALVATFGCVLPSCLIVLALAFAYYRFRGFRMVRNVLLQLRAAVVSMIAFAGLAIVFLAFWHKETAPSFADFPPYGLGGGVHLRRGARRFASLAQGRSHSCDVGNGCAGDRVVSVAVLTQRMDVPVWPVAAFRFFNHGVFVCPCSGHTGKPA